MLRDWIKITGTAWCHNNPENDAKRSTADENERFYMNYWPVMHCWPVNSKSYRLDSEQCLKHARGSKQQMQCLWLTDVVLKNSLKWVFNAFFLSIYLSPQKKFVVREMLLAEMIFRMKDKWWFILICLGYTYVIKDNAFYMSWCCGWTASDKAAYPHMLCRVYIRRPQAQNDQGHI